MNTRETRSFPIPQSGMLLENMEDGVCILEAAQTIRVVYASPGFYRMLETDPSALPLPCGLKELGIQPDAEEEYERIIRAGIPQKQTSKHLHRLRTRKGNWLWRHVRIAEIASAGESCPLFLEISRDISESVHNRLQLQENAERFQIAFGQSRFRLWDVTLPDRVFHAFSADLPSDGSGSRIPDFPEALLSEGVVHPDSAGPFRRFAATLLDGKSADTGNFIMKDQEGVYNWFALSYRQIHDQDGKPVKAVGIQERLPAVSGMFSFGLPRRPIPEALRHSLIARLHADLTADTVEELWMDGSDQTARVNGLSYSSLLKKKDISLFHQADEKQLLERLSRDSLLGAFAEGSCWSCEDYERVDSGGNISWVTVTLNLARDPVSGSVHLFACFCSAQKRHEWEALSGAVICRDSVTGLYDARTFRTISGYLLLSGPDRIVPDQADRCPAAAFPGDTDSMHALALIHLGGRFFHDGEAESEGCRRIRFTAVALAFALGPDCVLCRQEETDFLVFFPEAPSRFDVKKRLEDAFAYLRTVLRNQVKLDDIRFIACAVLGQNGNADYDLLLSRVSSLRGIYENAAMDMVVFPDMDEDWTWSGISKEDGADGISFSRLEALHSLTPEEHAAVFDCLTFMLNARTLKISMDGVLRRLGRYYHASRIYILALSEKRRTVTMLYEWTSRRKYSIQHILSGMPLDKFPLLQRCMKEKAPIITRSSGESFGFREEGKFWHYAAFPLFSKTEVRGFFCVENAQKHSDEPALINAMLPYLKQEQERYRNMSAPLPLVHGVLTRLPNLRAYLDIVDSLTSDTFSSMGALSLDVPNFSAINGNQGYDYGREMLSYIAETLSDVFGKAYLFRTWDAEFVVLYPNTIMEVFVSRCTRLRTMLQRRYPGQIRIGYTWADGIYNARNLVKEARSIMRCETVWKDTGERLAFLEESRFDVQEATSRGDFIVYFQPKVDMRDGSLAGAEALVRGIDRAGHIVPPGQFIELMEKDGTIRDLDLLMLEKVMEQMSEWKRLGFPDVNVSVNISRFTLFNPTTLASILAIQSHFPEIPPERVALEITETAGDVEKATLASVVDSFREYGLRFDLDDFGSHYANMSIFSNIRFHAIKLDRTLINDLPGNEISRMLVENIVRICRNFNMSCIAEGVENRQQEAALLAAGCTYAQGYYYARPLPVKRFEDQYLRQNRA